MRAIIAGLAGVLTLLCGPAVAQSTGSLPVFESEAELTAYVAQNAQGQPSEECPTDWDVCPGYEPGEMVVVTGSRIAPSTVTNNQEAGVDEGDIVKLHGNTLVVLRRGRLFTVDIAEGGLRPVDSIEAYPAGVDAEDDWYDEMLVANGWVAVIGYSYERETTEINRFRLDRGGRLTFVDSHRLTARDYYSSRNYASRLIGDRLVLYSPMSLEDGENPLENLPRLARWRPGGREQVRPLFSPADIHRSPSLIEQAPPPAEAIHTLVQCDLTTLVLECDGVAVIGPRWRSFYVSADAAYLWLSQAEFGADDEIVAEGSALHRFPFDGGAPGMARTLGHPGDQLSFAEDAQEGLLRVLVIANARDIPLWSLGPERLAAGLLQLPLSRFGDGEAPAVLADYRRLSDLPRNAANWQNRLTEDHAVYAYSSGWRGYESVAGAVHVAPFDGGPLSSWLIGGGVERVEMMGRDALVVSNSPDGVLFQTLNLIEDESLDPWEEPAPRISDEFLLEGAEGAETRSHAFFYQPDLASADGEFGILGLPVVQEAEDGEFFDQYADIAFVRRGNNRLAMLGTLDAEPENQTDDGCVASCIDWYGDARPIFIGDRIFALLGYELVDGRPQGRSIQEINRVSFAPGGASED